MFNPFMILNGGLNLTLELRWDHILEDTLR